MRYEDYRLYFLPNYAKLVKAIDRFLADVVADDGTINSSGDYEDHRWLMNACFELNSGSNYREFGDIFTDWDTHRLKETNEGWLHWIANQAADLKSAINSGELKRRYIAWAKPIKPAPYYWQADKDCLAAWQAGDLAKTPEHFMKNEDMGDDTAEMGGWDYHGNK
jgi:hypothetical protein